MRAAVSLLIVFLSLLPAQGQYFHAPELEQVIEKYLQAMGGRSALERVRSITFSAEFTDGQGRTLPLAIQKKQPTKSRLVIQFPHGRFIRAYDGTVAWQLLPGEEQAQLMTPEDAANFIREAPLSNALIRRDGESKVVYLGEEKLRSRSCHKIQIERVGAPRRIIFIDAEDYIERAFIDYVPNESGGIDEYETIPSDFRKIDGLLVAYGISSRKNGSPISSIRIQEVRVNAGVLDRIFTKP